MCDYVSSLKRHVVDIGPIGDCHHSGRVFGVTSAGIGAKVFSVPLTQIFNERFVFISIAVDIYAIVDRMF